MVTGTFAHEPSDELLNVRIEGEPEPIGCTPNHPFWSETRQEYVQAIQLEPGEEVWTAIFGIVAVESVTARPKSDRVYNLEVQGEHVYQVGESGVLVHNAKSYLNNIRASRWKTIFGKGKSWSSGRRNYWKNNGPGGKAPRRKVRVRDRKTGKERTITETKELHHKTPQSAGGTHDADNLEDVWPAQHDAIDPHRHTGYDEIQVLKYL